MGALALWGRVAHLVDVEPASQMVPRRGGQICQGKKGEGHFWQKEQPEQQSWRREESRALGEEGGWRG